MKHKYSKILTKKFLIKEYIKNKKSACQIARENNCSDSTIYRRLMKFDILIRPMGEALKGINNKYFKLLTKKFLIKQYTKNIKDAYKIALENRCSFTTVYRYLNIYKIKIRTKSETHKGQNNYRYNPELHKKHFCIDCGEETDARGRSKRCYSCNSKNNWKNKKFRDKTVKASLKAQNITPNKPEKVLIKLLNKILPNEYKFVGDGNVILGGFCPDFINCNGQKKIIELFGDYWHTLPKAKIKDKYRLETYKKYGYKTFVIWQHELKNLNKVKNKILEFNNV